VENEIGPGKSWKLKRGVKICGWNIGK